ncbi:MAG TPA: DUF4097 family beta strand repeat-containing protein [Acidobacteriota bacterium]|jgi:hypothetical protein|nr:DUF4097 family beta strand repeat-containing protein [Acidobacteriota bacterium]
METPLPAEAQPNRLPLILGLTLVAIGLLLFVGSLYHWEIWTAPWHFVGPLLLAAIGISSLWRYFSYTPEQALQGVRRRGKLVISSLFIFIAIAWFCHARGWFNGFQFAGRFWPALLILIGLAKIMDFYRLKGRAQFRFGEVLGVLLIILVGLGAAQVPPDLGPWMGPWWVRGPNNPFVGPSFTFTEEKHFNVRPVKISILNRFGNIHVTRGPGNEVTVRIEKVVYQEDDRKAKEIADQIQLVGEGSGDFSLRVNRKELENRNYRFKTHLELQIPQKAAIMLENAYGSVDAAQLEGACTINNSFGPVRVESVNAPVEINARFDRVSVRQVKGNVRISAHRGDVVVGEVTGNLEVENSDQSVSLENIHGSVRISSRHASIQISGVDKDLFVDAPNSSVKLEKVKGKCEVHNSHRKLELEEVAGPVRIENDYGDIVLINLKSAASVDAKHNSVKAETLRQGISISGDAVRISLDEVEGPIRVATSLRDVEISSFTGSVDVSTRNGDVRLTAPEVLHAPVRVTNENGDILLRLSEKARATLDIAATLGSIDNNLTEKLKVTQEEKDVTLKGALNGGGPQIRLQGTRSKIHLERLP